MLRINDTMLSIFLSSSLAASEDGGGTGDCENCCSAISGSNIVRVITLEIDCSVCLSALQVDNSGSKSFSRRLFCPSLIL